MREVDAEHSNQRLDNFLLGALKGAPRSLVYRIIRSGEVRVNGGRVKPMYRLQVNDKVRIPPITLSGQKPKLNAKLAATCDVAVLYEDDYLLVVDKPSGMAVHAGSGVQFGLIELLRAKTGAPFLELAHRLDRETSGCLLLAKKRSILTVLHEQLRNGEVSKQYQALVAGRWPKSLNKVSAALDVDFRRGGERHVRVHRDGKEALTTFQVLEQFGTCVLMQVSPKTGRTHQIRVHAAHSGHPILGDLKYGDKQANLDANKLGLKRLFLHAASLKFVHPKTGELLLVSVNLPADLAKILERM